MHTYDIRRHHISLFKEKTTKLSRCQVALIIITNKLWIQITLPNDILLRLLCEMKNWVNVEVCLCNTIIRIQIYQNGRWLFWGSSKSHKGQWIIFELISLTNWIPLSLRIPILAEAKWIPQKRKHQQAIFPRWTRDLNTAMWIQPPKHDLHNINLSL